MTIETKKWYESRTIWGAIITVAAMGAGALGYTVGAADQATLVDMLVTAAGFVGALIAIVGRVKADKKVG